MTDRIPIQQWDEQSAETAVTLPSRYFHDEAIFAEERERIFMQAWHFGCHVNELGEAGAFVVRDIFQQSVILMRDRQGEIHAFHNVCQHRGNRLLSETRGVNKGVIRCAYHSWCYGQDGALRSAPRSERLAGFDKTQHTIPPVRMEIFADCVFFNFAPDAPSMQTLFPGADQAMREAIPDLDKMQLVEEDDVIVPANWKVIMDNSIEGYHFQLSGPCHVDLAALIDFAGYRLRQFDHWWTYGAPPNPDTTQAYGKPLARRPESGDGFFNIGIWPHNTFYQFPFTQCLGTFMMIPLDSERSLLRFGYYSAQQPISEVSRASIEWMSNDLGPEDIELNVTVQQGLHSLGYNQGRYMIDAERSNESEHLVHHFHRLVFRALHPEASRL
ncbi:aromatic ring-hydroxylating dioxygenase subunit alpha [Halomonas sp. ML-15]|uniref:aromatic ring-hydroxylating oxygenase subunit alpha n=1 Tax=Halomonas sp. ML-15 TaxID=2773305 RepID=UPI0017462498|nr:aromatic ring-hydroxylating dioxygenase subunit alpha [Halomonas sp. ML-15]MBD3896177.1 aromatic ring-hydroxylating dioxygenase subunit alpha [Halomonas sp. ML-15]